MDRLMLQRQILVIETDLYYGLTVSQRQTCIMDRLCPGDRHVSWTDCVLETDLYYGWTVSQRQTYIMDRLCHGDRLMERLCHRNRLVSWTDCVM